MPAEAAAQTFVIPLDCAGMRIDQVLATLLPQHSRNRMKQWIEAGQVQVDGLGVAPKFRVRGGEQLAVAAIATPVATPDRPEDIELAIVAEDDALIIVNKPAGLVVHPGNGNAEGTLLNALLHHAPQLAAVVRAGIVHRLDKDTSGLLVIAKTPEAHTALTRQLAARSVKREYQALAWGHIEEAMTIDAPIGRHPTLRTSMAVVASGRSARTHVTPLAQYGIATLVRCTLDTGRTHQIRVHLAAARHPLLGDPTYGRQRTLPGIPIPPRQALHAWRLALTHPTSGKPMRWRADPPADFATLRDALADFAAARDALLEPGSPDDD
jgi:23S rRNA pseudouridine1911/1915/1917 synthase